ncbi:MAG: cyclohexadieny/prephenate dehydrogenase / 3-phosphoshikimate 1-carboxyvinyltransferase [Gaiellales bacterium]|nr:cyclohexadieny/prephenate dehydrogenase / 3-phosphoshikimate 1-carboxyvinyltransferase [Gaiellales bacterium]
MSAATGADRLDVAPAAALAGEIAVPGDKSISHRSLLIGAVCDGTTEISGFGANADTMATLAAVETLGARVERLDPSATHLRVHGRGLRGLQAPAGTIDVLNAGTLMRLLPGLLVGQSGSFTLDGDESIRRRPVDRITMPLKLMGAVLGDSDGRPPLHVDGGNELAPIGYELPVASAQVKSCILLAGLYAATGPTTVIEPVPTRDHTERLLRAAGARVAKGQRTVSVWPVERLELGSVDVPGDISSAAPFLVAATLLAESRLFIRGMSINPTRTGLLTVLERMGARINLFNRRATSGGEPIADVEVHPAELVATEIEAEIVPSMVDELPLLALAATMARGRTVVRGARELRVKESNRLETVAELLRAIGGHVRATDDGWEIQGVPARPAGGRVDAHGDHRIGMLGAVAGLVSRGGVRIDGASAIGVSYPTFAAELERLAVRPW